MKQARPQNTRASQSRLVISAASIVKPQQNQNRATFFIPNSKTSMRKNTAKPRQPPPPAALIPQRNFHANARPERKKISELQRRSSSKPLPTVESKSGSGITITRRITGGVGGSREQVEGRKEEEKKREEPLRQPRNIMIRRTPRPISSREIEETDRQARIIARQVETSAPPAHVQVREEQKREPQRRAEIKRQERQREEVKRPERQREEMKRAARIERRERSERQREEVKREGVISTPITQPRLREERKVRSTGPLQELKSALENRNPILVAVQQGFQTQAPGAQRLRNRLEALRGQVQNIYSQIQSIEPIINRNSQNLRHEGNRQNRAAPLSPNDPQFTNSSGNNPLAIVVRMREMSDHLQILTQFLDFYSYISQPVERGVAKSKLDTFPCRQIDTIFLRRKGLWKEESLSRCLICLEDYAHLEEVRTLPCIHYFHKKCIDEWLGQSTYCPMCKYNFGEQLPEMYRPRKDVE